MYTKKQRIISFIACVAFVLVTFCSVIFIAKSANHFCKGDNCPICAAIEIAENTIRNLSNGIIPTGSGFTAVNAFFCFILIAAKEAQSERLEHFIKTLKAQNGVLNEFDERLWCSMVEFVTVGRYQGNGKKEIVVTFRDGTEIEA